MIIRLTKANFSSNNIGKYTTEPGTLTFKVSPSSASWTLTCAAMSPSTKTGTGNTTWTNIPAGSTVSYEVSLSGYNTQKGSISIYGNTTKTVTLSEVGSVTPPVTPDPEKPGTGGGSGSGTTWYIKSLKELNDSGNDFSTKTKLACNKEYAWAFRDASNSKLVGRTINTIEMYVCETGNGKFIIGVYDPETFTITESRIINIDASHAGTIQTYTFNDLTIPSGKYFVWNAGYTGGEAIGYYILKANLDPLAVETSGWYQVKKTGLSEFGAHELVFTANIGYTGSGSPNPDTPDSPNPELPENATWYIQSLKQLEDSGNNITSNCVILTPNSAYSWAFQESFNNKLAGNTINTVRMLVHKQGSTGKFVIGVYDPETHVVSEKREIITDASHAGTIQTYTFNDLTIPSGKYFVWNCSRASGETSGAYVLKNKLDATKVETSGWYMAKDSSMDKFSNYELVFVADFGYVPR